MFPVRNTEAFNVCKARVRRNLLVALHFFKFFNELYLETKIHTNIHTLLFKFTLQCTAHYNYSETLLYICSMFASQGKKKSFSGVANLAVS